MGRAWLCGLLAAAPLLASCDQPITDDRPIPAGQIQPAKVSAMIVNTGTVTPINGDVNPLNGDVNPVNGLDPSIGCTGNSSCPAPPDACNAYTCDTSTGSCILGPTNENGPCDDGNACTSGDMCTKGSCVGVQKVTCPTPDQCHDQGMCDPTSGKCTNPAKADGTTCSDGKTCTSGDQCVSGVCTGTVHCPASDQCHDVGACTTSGGCTNPVKADNTPCNDLSVCTQNDVCIGGVCTGQSPKLCTSPPDQCHDVGKCDPTSGSCVYPLKQQGAACDDGMLCTWGDACDANGVCAGTPVSPPCVSDQFADRACNGTQTCTVTPKQGAACDDGNPCTKGDVLDAAGNCAGMPYTCPVGSCLVSSTCDGKGGCVNMAKTDGSPCDADGSKCTPMDRCQAGACVKDPNPVVCVTKDCNTASCDPQTGNCVYKPTSGGACGVTGCYSAGTCSDGACSGTPKDCSAFDGPCSAGVCNAATGGCVAAPKPNGTSCDPGGKCATGAVCAFGECQLAPASCPAPTGPCALEVCDPTTGTCGMTNKTSGTACDPMTACMGPGACDDQGQCLGAPLPNGQSCTLPGGALGICLTGACAQVEDPPTPGVDAAPGSSPDAGGALGGGGRSGCGCAAAGGAAGSLGLVAFGAALLLGRRRARRR
jgi:hypothetical protein